jgi:hypothetical protein
MKNFSRKTLIGRDDLEDVNVDGRIILKWVLKQGEREWTKFNWLWIGASGGLKSTW